MACVDELFVGDTGTSIEFLVKECDDTVDPPVEVLVDVSSATLIEITFLKPDDTTLPVVGSFLTDGTDSIVRYITLLNTLDIAGPWKGQAKITMPSGSWYTSKISFTVKDVL